MHNTSLRPAAVALLLLAVAALHAQDPPPAPQPAQQPTFRTGANFVRVDVYPTRGGVPIADLVAADFEVLEDGVAQTIQTFEHVLIRPAGTQTARVDPDSQQAMLQAAANPRNRVFVVFLDAPHVSVSGSHDIAGPLVRLIDRVLGPDDLVGVMTPAMSASQLVLARKTQVTEENLRKGWTWGDRFTLRLDELEQRYVECYPKLPGEEGNGRLYSDLATKMIDRKRERSTLESLEDLVRYLGAIREERKAILTVTEGWALFREDSQMTDLRKSGQYQEPIPGKDQILVGPDGKITTKDKRDPYGATKYECDADRMRLAMMDNERYFRDIMDEANRRNASFYPIDPRGLPVFDTPIGPNRPLSPVADRASLTARLETLRTLAANTDGMAVLNSNDLDSGLRRISDDLNSYYLLGYTSTNTRLDGRFRELKVRVKRPGVDVRARRGYRAATADEVASATRATDPPSASPASAASAALGSLGRIRSDVRFRVHASAAPSSSGATIWVAGELQAISGQDPFAPGATADVEVSGEGSSGTARVTLGPGERAFLTPVRLPRAATGPLDVRVRLASADRSAPPLTDAIRLESSAPQPLMYRRGPATANRVQPAADLRFSRTDRLRLELPVDAGSQPGEARVLDRAAQPLAVPATVSQRTDTDTGQRWLTVDVVLAPLAPADYLIEIALKRGPTEERILTAIRVTR